MKNVRQLLELSSIKDQEIRELFEKEYEDALSSSDNYFRYYPSDNSYDTIDGLTDKINEWLVKEGYSINLHEEYFYIIISWDW